jgi:uncharacterized membrane protein
MFVLLGIAVVVFGFVVRANPLLVVLAAAIVTGLAAAWTPGLTPDALWAAAVHTLAQFGKAFNDNRFISIVWLVLAAIGLLERGGLQERARIVIGRIKAATVGRLLWTYLIVRQLTAMIGLTSLGGHAQMVRPLVAPMAEGAAEARYGALPDHERFLVRAHAAAVDNIGVFFGEDVFIAMSSVLLIQGFMEQNGVAAAPLDISRWAIPTAITAFVIHSARLWRLDRRLKRALTKAQP